MANDIKISLTSKGTPTINLSIGDEAKNIIEANSSAPIITYVATGDKGEQGEQSSALIAPNSVTRSHIQANAISSAEIDDNAIAPQHIAANAITSSHIADGEIVASNIANGVLTADLFATGTISESVIDVMDNGAIVTNKLKDLAITATKLGTNAVTTTKIENDAVTKAKIAPKTLTGAEIEDNVVLGGTTHVTAIQIDGSSPGYIYGPADDIFYIKSYKDLIFVCDSDQDSNPDTSNFKFQNSAGTNLFTLDESGNAVFAGNISLTGNITVSGTVDGVNVAESLGTTQAQLTKVNYISVTQNVDLDAMEAKLDGITDNEAIDWTIDQGGTNIHAGNYTDTNTQLSTEEVQDIVGAMFTSNTETRVAATYDDSDGTIDLVVDDMTADTTYSAMGPGNSYAAGLVPEGDSSHAAQFLRKDGAWVTPPDTNTTYVEATSSYMGLMSSAHHDKLDGIASGATAYTDADAVSAVATADDYLKNDASDTIAGDLTIDSDYLYINDQSGGGAKSRITTGTLTANRTITIPDNTGVIALTNKWIDVKTSGYWASSTGGYYITLGGASTNEGTSLATSSYTSMFVAPYDGKILRISSFHQASTSRTSTLEVYIDGDDSDLVNDQRGSDMTTSSYGQKFTEDCPADWTFSKGEAIAIKRTDTAAVYGTTMSIVFEYDTTT